MATRQLPPIPPGRTLPPIPSKGANSDSSQLPTQLSTAPNTTEQEQPPVCPPVKQRKEKFYEFIPESLNTEEVEATGLLADIYPEGSVEQYYSIGKYLGRGGFAKVYHAKRNDTGSDYAIKIIDKVMSMQCDKVALLTEIQLMSVNSHPHIVMFTEAYETPSRVYVVMEFLSGGTIFDLRERGKFWEDGKWTPPHNELKLKTITKQVIEAVKYLHEYITVHRDLKPENILASEKSENSPVKLIDFGMAKTLEAGQKEFQQCGTQEYQAPEMLSEKGYDLKIDMWSIGIMLYLLITGHFPFEDKNSLKLRSIILTGKISWDYKGWNLFSEQAKDFVQKLLKSDPDARMSATDALSHPWVN